MNAQELMQEIEARKIPFDRHNSDLYLPVTAEVMELLCKYEHRRQVTTFKSQYDGKMWYDIPFAYLPFFEERLKSVR